MMEYSAADRLEDWEFIPGKDLDQYYSVEIPIREIGVVYQYKIWEARSKWLYILVKDNSAILSRIKVGDRLYTKYYSTDFSYPYQNVDSVICCIARQEHGRLKGHYLVSLKKVKDNKKPDKTPWPYHRLEAMIPHFDNGLRTA